MSKDAPEGQEWRLKMLYFFVGMGPSWILSDGVFAQIAVLNRKQPEGRALATYLSAVSASTNTIVVPGFEILFRWLGWSYGRWVILLTWLQLASCCLAAAAWSFSIGGVSLALYLVLFLASLSGNAQQLVLFPWLAAEGQSDRIPTCTAGSVTGALVAAALAYLQVVTGGLGGPSVYFMVLAGIFVVACAAVHVLVKTDEKPPADDDDENDEPAPRFNPLQIDHCEDTGEMTPDSSDLIERRGLLSGPIVAFLDPKRRHLNAVAWSNAYMQLVTWVAIRSIMPYAVKAGRPKSASSDAKGYLALAIDGSLVGVFAGAIVATIDGAVSPPLLLVNITLTLAFGLCLCTVIFSDPPLATPALVVALVVAAILVRVLDGYCSPLWYRQVHELTGSAEVVKQAGGLAIYVAMTGVWVAIALVVLLDG